MKILIATAVYFPMINGVAVFSHNLATGLKSRGHDVVVICPSDTGKTYISSKSGVKTYYLKSTDIKIYPDQIHDAAEREKFFHAFYKHGLRVSAFPSRAVKKILNSFRPDVVHVQVSDPIGISVVDYAKKLNIPVVTTEHNRPDVITSSFLNPSLLKTITDNTLENFFIYRHKKSDFVTMPTRYSIDELFRGRNFKVPIAAVSNGIDLNRFHSGKPDKSIYQKYQINEFWPIVLYIGRVDPEKNVGRLLKTFARVHEKISDAHLVIVGDGTDLENAKQLAKTWKIAQNVRFLGRVTGNDLNALYRVGTVFATASEIETQGIVLIEAAASGLPLVAVDKGAVSEIVKNDQNGYLISPISNIPIEMSKKLVEILSDKTKQKTFSKNSIKFASEHDFNHTLDQFINIYNYVIIKK